MGTAQDVLNIARTQLGVAEDPPGSNRVSFATWAGIPGQPWCAAFTCWCLDGGGALDIPRFVWTPTGASLYRIAGRFGSEPRIGAVVFFAWPEAGRIAHVGLVEALRADGAIVTIEGNTDEAGGRTGGKVMRQVRRAFIAGYGYPVYTELAPSVPVTVAAKPMLRRGSRGELVKVVQRKLGVAADGIFGPITDRAVRQFQRNNRLAPDGIVGPKTWAKLG